MYILRGLTIKDHLAYSCWILNNSCGVLEELHKNCQFMNLMQRKIKKLILKRKKWWSKNSSEYWGSCNRSSDNHYRSQRRWPPKRIMPYWFQKINSHKDRGFGGERNKNKLSDKTYGWRIWQWSKSKKSLQQIKDNNLWNLNYVDVR